jgi:predicted dehydrogenase
MRHQQGERIEEIALAVCNQYTIQGDRFAQAVLEDGAVPTPLADAVANMRVLEALLESAKSGTWV